MILASAPELKRSDVRVADEVVRDDDGVRAVQNPPTTVDCHGDGHRAEDVDLCCGTVFARDLI